MLLVLATTLGAGSLRAEEQDTAFEGFVRAPDPEGRDGEDAVRFREAVTLQAKGRYREARRRLWRLLEEFPDSPFASEAEDRSGPNAFLGFRLMNEPRPSERRIDVALMGDGYTLEKQDRFDDHAADHLRVLLKEPVFAAYEPYFNFWRFNLASQDSGVDEVEPPPPDEEMEEQMRRRRARKTRPVKTYETALDCKAAGPQGQVAANPRCVWHYLSYLDVNDALAICFAQKGQLGMGGMGIATTGPRGVVVHEFGHAFSGLLDEYANHPGPPSGFTEAANTTTNRQSPPWKHFLDAGVPGVGVYEGAATFQTGVWRPAPSCAMNTNAEVYCPVCREATILAIYTYVSPIDERFPAAQEVVRGTDGWPVIGVIPMRPVTHELEVRFFLGDEPPVTEGEVPTEQTPEEAFGEDMLSDEEREVWERIRKRRPKPEPGATRPAEVPHKPGSVRRGRGTGRDEPPPGRGLRVRRERQEGGERIYVPAIPKLAPGRYLLTAVVRDPARPRGERHAWVLKDDRGLLEDRCTWTLVVPE